MATRWLAVLLLSTATAGCASMPFLGPILLLGQADHQAREGEWEVAVASYDEFLARYPDDRAAPRVRERRDTLAATLGARLELVRQRDEVVRLRAELAGLREQEARLRESRTRLRGDAADLRDEVIRLRDELGRRERDLARTRQELAARQAEAERLRDDIERLKQIDLQLERRR